MKNRRANLFLSRAVVLARTKKRARWNDVILDVVFGRAQLFCGISRQIPGID